MKEEMRMTRDEAAAQLNGREYGEEESPDLWKAMAAAGLVAIFGASDDLMEIRGAAYEEIGAYNGGAAFFTKDGFRDNRCANERCPYHKEEADAASMVEVFWDTGGFSWKYETKIPHSTFVIKEDGENYC